MWLTKAVRSLPNNERTQSTVSTVCCSASLIGTKRMLDLPTTSQMAALSLWSYGTVPRIAALSDAARNPAFAIPAPSGVRCRTPYMPTTHGGNWAKDVSSLLRRTVLHSASRLLSSTP